ncbi:hypothetical protein HMI54_000751, partial [Coelomomyces lativittatus]
MLFTNSKIHTIENIGKRFRTCSWNGIDRHYLVGVVHLKDNQYVEQGLKSEEIEKLKYKVCSLTEVVRRNPTDEQLETWKLIPEGCRADAPQNYPYGGVVQSLYGIYRGR